MVFSTNAVLPGMYNFESPVEVGRRVEWRVRLMLSGMGGKRRRVSLITRRATISISTSRKHEETYYIDNLG